MSLCSRHTWCFAVCSASMSSFCASSPRHPQSPLFAMHALTAYTENMSPKKSRRRKMAASKTSLQVHNIVMRVYTPLRQVASSLPEAARAHIVPAGGRCILSTSPDQAMHMRPSALSSVPEVVSQASMHLTISHTASCLSCCLSTSTQTSSPTSQDVPRMFASLQCLCPSFSVRSVLGATQAPSRSLLAARRQPTKAVQRSC